MTTFNELLVTNGIDPGEVAILRHTGRRGRLGHTLHELWSARDGRFDLYQSTQRGDKQLFRASRIWASFVVEPDGSTLFVGLYDSTRDDRAKINWTCPLDGYDIWAESEHKPDLYRLEPMQPLSQFIGELKIIWDKGYVAWARRALANEWLIAGTVADQTFEAFTSSAEGHEIWRLQKTRERDIKLATKAFEEHARRNGGKYKCQACDFLHGDRGLFDAHHVKPLLAGFRKTHYSELAVLCPTCHRRAHRSGNRLQPYSLEELRSWAASGRP